MERLEKQHSQDMERLEKMHREDLERREKGFSKLLEKCSSENDQSNSMSFSQDYVINSIGGFWHCPEEEVTFAAYL